MVEVAKLAIAHVILKAEAESHLARKSISEDSFLTAIGELRDTWIGRIAEYIGPRLHRRLLADALKDVAFIIFNYDRYVQQGLFGELRCQGVNRSTAYEVVNHLPIIHVYGSIGAFGGPSAVAPFGKESSLLTPIAQGIRTYTENVFVANELSKMRDILSGANKTVFLGFGFHPANMTHLRDYGLNMQSQFYGACTQPDKTRLENAKQLLFSDSQPDQTAHLTDLDCNSFIREYRSEIFGT